MDIKLSDEMLRTVVSDAIFKSMGDDQRSALVMGAIKHLLTPVKPSYGYGEPKSPLTEAFEIGIRAAAIELCRKMLAEDEAVKEKIQGLLSEAMVRLTETNREKTVEKLADAISAGMAYRERD